MTINLDELKTKLRERSGQYDEYGWHAEVELQAADAIEQLQRELEGARKDAALKNTRIADLEKSLHYHVNKRDWSKFKDGNGS